MELDDIEKELDDLIALANTTTTELTIRDQVRDNPLTRDQCRDQFVRVSGELGIKHSFDFDEAYDIGLEIRRRNEFRSKVSELQEAIIEIPGTSGEAIHKVNPVKHTFAGGCYIREIYNPANELIITKIHKKEHPFFLMKGEMSILTEEGVQHIKAPFQGITKVGTKRVIYTHEECIFTTVHSTDNTTISEAEEEIACVRYEDLPPGCDVLEVMKKINLKQG
jgi:hypothetical protein